MTGHETLEHTDESLLPRECAGEDATQNTLGKEDGRGPTKHATTTTTVGVHVSIFPRRLTPPTRKRRHTFSTMANLHLVNTGSATAPEHHRVSLLLSSSVVRSNLYLHLPLHSPDYEYASTSETENICTLSVAPPIP